MDQYFEGLGHLGMFLSAFVAGSILPFSSEAVLCALFSAGFGFVQLIILATLGNSLGGMLGYYLGYIAKLEWINKYLKIEMDSINKWKVKIENYGSYLAFLCWLPIVGDPLSVALGLFRVNPIKVFIFMTMGKFIRYFVVLWLFSLSIA